MSTDIRPELSKNNPYYISKHRYYELKHFCLQYREWKDALRYGASGWVVKKEIESGVTDKTADDAINNHIFKRKIEIVERTCEEVAQDLSPYLLEAVTQGSSYAKLQASNRIPCCKDVFYHIYRRFFYELSRNLHGL